MIQLNLLFVPCIETMLTMKKKKKIYIYNVQIYIIQKNVDYNTSSKSLGE